MTVTVADTAAASTGASENSLPGQVVVVGGGQGIGAAIARRMADDPLTTQLVIADLRLDAVTELAEQLGAGGRDVRAEYVDVTSRQSIEDLVAKTNAAQRVAVTAGIFGAKPSLDVEVDEFERILQVNLVGVFFVAQAYARCMVARGSGSIVATASIAARMPRLRQAAYSASKAGLRQALRVLAMETVPAGVRINTVSPGPTDTPMMRELARDHDLSDLAQGSRDANRPPILDGRVATPEDIADAVSFLLGPSSAHIAMQDLVVDGGELLGI